MAELHHGGVDLLDGLPWFRRQYELPSAVGCRFPDDETDLASRQECSAIQLDGEDRKIGSGSEVSSWGGDDFQRLRAESRGFLAGVQ
jgi:hypothetical protein